MHIMQIAAWKDFLFMVTNEGKLVKYDPREETLQEIDLDSDTEVVSAVPNQPNGE